MEIQNPYQPTAIDASLSRGRVYAFAWMSLLVLVFAVSALKLGYNSYAFLLLPLVFGCTIPWALGYRLGMIITCAIVSFLSSLAGIEVALSIWDLMPTTNAHQAVANERTMIAAYVVGSFVGAWVTIVLRVVLQELSRSSARRNLL